MKHTLLALTCCIGLCQAAEVLSWVPPYGIAEVKDAIATNANIPRGLSWMGLQFWNPKTDGTITFAPVNSNGTLVTDADVSWFRDWAHQNKIKVFLTVYNNSEIIGKWDWALARSAFQTNKGVFAKALVDEMERLQLDGIDIDVEGTTGIQATDSTNFRLFVEELSTQIKAKGKLLNIDSFHSPCGNAPMMKWWSGWKGKADGIVPMGYGDLSEASTAKLSCTGSEYLFRFSWQQSYGVKAGFAKDQILMGIPGDSDNWGGKTLLEHLKDLKALGASVSIWDMQFGPAGWTDAAVWDVLEEIKALPKQDPSTEVRLPLESMAMKVTSQGIDLGTEMGNAIVRVYDASGEVLETVITGQDGKAKWDKNHRVNAFIRIEKGNIVHHGWTLLN